MIAREVNILLTKAALVDPRMKRVDPAERADMATAWAELLDDVDLEQALAALRTHYRSSSEPITPARVLELVGAESAPYPYRSIDDDLPGSKRAVLEAFGVTPEQFDGDPVVRARVIAEHKRRELEAGRG